MSLIQYKFRLPEDCDKVQSYETGAIAVDVSDELLSQMKEMKQCMPELLKVNVWKSKIAPFANKVYPRGRYNVENDSPSNGGLVFPVNSIIVDAIQMLSCYPYLPCGPVDWNSASYKCIVSQFQMETNNDMTLSIRVSDTETVVMKVEFQCPLQISPKLKHFQVTVTYRNSSTQDYCEIKPFAQHYIKGNERIGITEDDERLYDHTVHFTFQNRFNLEYLVHYEDNNENIVTNYFFNNICYYNTPTVIELIESADGDIISIKYQFRTMRGNHNYFPLFQHLYYDRYFQHIDNVPRTLSCFQDMADILNDQHLLASVRRLALLGMKRKIIFKMRFKKVAHLQDCFTVTENEVFVPEPIPADLLGNILSYLYVDISPFFLSRLITIRIRDIKNK